MDTPRALDTPPPVDHAKLLADKRKAVVRLQAVLGEATVTPEVLRGAFEDLETLFTVCAQEGVPISAEEDALYESARERLAD